MKVRRALLLLLTFVLAVVSAGGIWVWQAKRQYALNRQLIAALNRGDRKTALVLVNAGADPNTRMGALPAPTLPQLFHQLLHRSPPPANNSSTAFHLACGAVLTDLKPENLTPYPPPDDTPLVKAMLVHGADVHAINKYRYSALYYAILWKHPHSAQLLLDYGANVNASNGYGTTPLMVAAEGEDVDTTRRFLEHDGSMTLTDKGGNTVLHHAMYGYANPRIIGMLLAHGADPHARNKNGDTPFRLAQQMKRPDLVRLMRGTR